MTQNAPGSCASAPNGRHAPHWREWRVAEREGRTIRCLSCGRTVWPVCSTCGQPRVGWETHGYDHPAHIDGSGGLEVSSD